MNRFKTSVLIGVFVFVAAFHGSDASAGIVYVTDFEGTVGPEWSMNSTVDSAPGLSTFLGRYANDVATLSLSVVPGVQHVLYFDLYIIDSWDGFLPIPSIAGPDRFTVTIDGNVLFDNTFYNNTADGMFGYQSFREPDAPRTDLGFSPYPEAIYRNVEIAFTPASSSVQISFEGFGLQGVDDESWGLDNIEVNAVPEPATATLFAAAIVAASAFLRRRA